MMTKTTAQHVCFGKVFCGFPREIAQAECPACTPPRDELVGEIAADGTVTRRRVPLTCSTCEQSGDALVTGHGLVCEYCDTVTPA